MIKTKRELQDWITFEGARYESFPNEPRMYVKLLRTTEYHKNSGKPTSKVLYPIFRLLLEKRSQVLGLSIPLNVFDRGLCIVHYGSVAVNPKARIGKNCRIYNNTVIGTSGDGFSGGGANYWR